MAYQFGDIEYDFSPMTTADVLKAKSVIMAMGQEQGNLHITIEANEILDKMAFKYVKVKDKKGDWIEKLDQDTIKLYFTEEEAFIDISLNFLNKVLGFLEKSPTLQTLQGKPRKK